MPNPTISLTNTTLSDINLIQLGINVPGSSTILATDSVLVSDIINDPQLNAQVDAGDITLVVDAVTLTEAQSSAYINYTRQKDNFAATTAPTINDDADAGFSVGSLWVNTATDTMYVCVDSTNNAAVWVVGGVGAGAFAPPVTIGTTNQEGDAGTLVRSNHVHAHGDQPGGSLHALATPDPGGVAGFMSPADKEKLDELVPTNGDSQFTSVVLSTTLNTYQDAFPAQNLTAPETGFYWIQFEGNIAGSSGNTVNEIAVSINGVPVTDSERQMQGNGGASLSTYTHTFQSLTAGDTVTGVWRKSAGSGTSFVGNRRVTILRLNIAP